jgi:tol-pal system protein YbgF
MIIASRHRKNNRKARIFLGLLAFSTFAFNVTAAHAQSEREMANRIKRLENEMQTMSRAIYKGEEPPPGAFSGGADAAGLTVRIDQLETQLRDMNGRLEEQANQIDQLRQSMERMGADIDMRLGSGAAPSQPPRYTTQAASSYESPQPSDSTYGADGGHTAPYPQDTNPQGGYQWSSNAAGSGEPTLGTLGSSPAPNDPGAMMYENAFSQLKSGQYDAAEQGFQQFLSANPNHSLAGNAKYWLGESFYARGQYDKASRTFAEAYQQYPKSPKAPDNLLKLGMSLAGEGKKDDACIALGQIEKEFATTAGPVLRRAKEEMTNFGCS